MKKVLTIITCLLCALYASALSYASPYKGAGRNGYIHTSAPMRSSMGTRAVMAQAPVVTMGSTSISMSRGIASSSEMATTPVSGIYTAASAIHGGVTTYDGGGKYAPGRRKAGKDTPPSPDDDGYCEHCHYVWDGSLNHGKGGWICEHCGCELKDGCDCADESGYCWCPLDLNWAVMLFFAVLAMAYGAYKKRTSTVQ